MGHSPGARKSPQKWIHEVHINTKVTHGECLYSFKPLLTILGG